MSDQPYSEGTNSYTVVSALSWSPSGEFIAIATSDYEEDAEPSFHLHIVNAQTLQLVWAIEGEKPISHLGWSYSDNRMYLMSRGLIIDTYNVSTGTMSRNYQTIGFVRWMDVSKDGVKIALVYLDYSNNDQIISIIDTTSGVVEHQISIDYSIYEYVRWIGFSPDNAFLAARTASGHVLVWRTDTFAIVETIQSITHKSASAGDWHPDSRVIAFNHPIQGVITVSLDAPSQVGVINYPDYVRDLRWHPDGRQIAVVSGAVDVIDASSGQIIKRVPAENATAVAWNSDGVLAVGDSRGPRLRLTTNDNPYPILITTVTQPPLSGT